MTARFWDGYLRWPVSARHVGTYNQRVRVEMLDCGHEQAFVGNKGNRGCTGARVCRQCEDVGRRMPLDPDGGRRAGTVKEVPTRPAVNSPPAGMAAQGGERDERGVL